MLSCFSSFQLFATPWIVAHQAPLSIGFSRQEHWIGFPLPSPGDLPSPGIEPRSPALQADSLSSEPPGNLKRHPRRKPSDCPSRAGSCLPTALSTPQACCVLLLPFRVLLNRVILTTVKVSWSQRLVWAFYKSSFKIPNACFTPITSHRTAALVPTPAAGTAPSHSKRSIITEAWVASLLLSPVVSLQWIFQSSC